LFEKENIIQLGIKVIIKPANNKKGENIIIIFGKNV